MSVARVAETYGLPNVLPTVNVAANGQPPTIPELREIRSDSVEIDRTQINSREDVDFRQAVEATGRKKLVMAALWTEVCLDFPALDALREGYEVLPFADAVGGTSPEAHRTGRERIIQAGAQPIGWVSPACELQRDWARTDTVSKWSTSGSLRDSAKGSELLRRSILCPSGPRRPSSPGWNSGGPNSPLAVRQTCPRGGRPPRTRLSRLAQRPLH